MTVVEGRAPGLDDQLTGVTFTVPSPAITVARNERLALAYFGGGTAYYGRDQIEYEISPGAVDLGLVRTGRAPVLQEHAYALECLLGMIVAAEVEGPLLRCLVRFAEGGAADRYWQLLCQSFPLSLSMGARISHSERIGTDADARPLYRATRWQLREISLVTFGKDEAAHIRSIGEGDDLSAMVERMQTRHGAPERTAIRSALHLDRWESWARVAGPKLSFELGTEPHALSQALAREVAEHCATLERDLSL